MKKMSKYRGKTHIESYKERLSLKSIKELKAIYIRITKKDLLRGSKIEMINVLASLLDSSRQGKIIINGKE